MQTIGLIGGMSWESTALYYRIINEYIKEKLRGLHSAKILMYSVDFAEIEHCQSLGQWDKSAEILTDAAKRLEIGGADFIVICTNTMHKVAPQVEKNINIPILHIADTTAAELATSNIKKTALLGTKYTMTQEFYKERIAAKGIDVVVPGYTEIEIVNSIIYDELCLGIVSEKSRSEFQKIISRLKNEENAEAVILGCTEIGLLIKQSDSPLPFLIQHIFTHKLQQKKHFLMKLKRIYSNNRLKCLNRSKIYAIITARAGDTKCRLI